jgi:hypothetical protein
LNSKEWDEIDHNQLSDLIHEIADGRVPIYTNQLLEVAQSNMRLAVDEPEVYGFS